MAITKTLGGERLGSEGGMKVSMHNYYRSTHDIGMLFKTDQACGTLVPCFCDFALNGTTYYIDLATKVRTLPTNGPIFGRFKHQVDVFQAPIRLYIAALHNNALGIGLKMANIKLPQLRINANTSLDTSKPMNQQQISQDSILAYLGIRGLGHGTGEGAPGQVRKFNALHYLMYWDIYKNYFANKQEEEGVVIDRAIATQTITLTTILVNNAPEEGPSSYSIEDNRIPQDGSQRKLGVDTIFEVKFNRSITREEFEKYSVNLMPRVVNFGDTSVFNITTTDESSTDWSATAKVGIQLSTYGQQLLTNTRVYELVLQRFPLSNIDEMRMKILSAPTTTPFEISSTSETPYSTPLEYVNNELGAKSSQVGLGIRTYLSDRFNNWLSTEWIEGTTGINEITAIDVSSGKLSMNELILQKKIFDLLNRIAISGGSYNDWQEAAYGERSIRMAESPIYCGGLSSDITFDEVVSTADTQTDAAGDQPLGSLAGRGTDRANKGGSSIRIKIKEPSMIMIIESIVPRVDYSQGNKWFTRLETMDDFHKPGLDQIGFQELLSEEFAAFDTTINRQTGEVTYKSVGKQPSWIEYMTNQSESFGSFAFGGELDYMAVNRGFSTTQEGNLKDATTYIDPTLYNRAFADAKLSAKNFWVQIAIDCNVRRKMSAKQIPNL